MWNSFIILVFYKIQVEQKMKRVKREVQITWEQYINLMLKIEKIEHNYLILLEENRQNLNHYKKRIKDLKSEIRFLRRENEKKGK